MPASVLVLSDPEFRRITLRVRRTCDRRADFTRVVDERVTALDHFAQFKSRMRAGRDLLTRPHAKIAYRIDRATFEQCPFGESTASEPLQPLARSALRQQIDEE